MDHQVGSDLRSAYIGDSAVRYINSLSGRVSTWNSAWNNTTPADGEDENAPEEPHVSAPSPAENRYNETKPPNSDTATSAELPVDVLRHLLTRAGADGIARFSNALNLALPTDNAGQAATTLMRRVPEADWWTDVRKAKALAEAWTQKFHDAAHDELDALDDISRRFGFDEQPNPGHLAATAALAWLVNDSYRHELERWISKWATTITHAKATS